MYGLASVARAQWATAPAGRRLFTTEQLQKLKAEEDVHHIYHSPRHCITRRDPFNHGVHVCMIGKESSIIVR